MADLPMESHTPTDADKKFWDALKAALAKGTTEDGLDIRHAFALASQFVGMLLAVQDRKYPKEMYLEEIIRNIETGNQDFIQSIFEGADNKQ